MNPRVDPLSAVVVKLARTMRGAREEADDLAETVTTTAESGSTRLPRTLRVLAFEDERMR